MRAWMRADGDVERLRTAAAAFEPVRQVLDEAEGEVEKFADRPRIEARLRYTIGKVYQNLGLYEEATPQLETALELRRGASGMDDVVAAAMLADLGAIAAG